MVKNVNTLVGVFFTSALADAGMKVAALSRAIDVAQPTMSRMLRGESDISIARMYAICAALKVEPTDVLEYIEENQSKKGKTAKPAVKEVRTVKTAAKPSKVNGKRVAREVEEDETPRRRGRPAKATTPVKAEPAKRRGRPAKVAEKEVSPRRAVKTAVASKATKKVVKPVKRARLM